jgi:hypothetical protein
LEETTENKPVIWKELVLGFAVIEACIYHSIRTIPIVTASNAEEAIFTDNLTRLTKLEEGETVKGIQPKQLGIHLKIGNKFKIMPVILLEKFLNIGKQ